MQDSPVLTGLAPGPAFSWPASGTQFLPVTGRITERLFVTYRADAERLAPLVPFPLTLDSHRSFGFVSVCAVEIVDMGIAGTPRFLRFDNREFLYRLAVRFRGEPTFITLRSDVSSRALAFLGRHFSHYRPKLAKVRFFREQERERLRMECVSQDGHGDAVLDAELGGEAQPSDSVFDDRDAAVDFLLGMRFSADVVGERVRVQPIEHAPWRARPAFVHAARFAFIESLQRSLGARFDYDGTLAMRGLRQTWGRARWI